MTSHLTDRSSIFSFRIGFRFEVKAKVSIRSCFVIRVRDKITTRVINPSKLQQRSNVWEQQYENLEIKM